MLMNGKYFSITSLHKFEKPVSIKEEVIKDVIITYWPFQESDTLIMPFYRFCIRFLYKGIIIKHNKTEPTYTKTSLFLCEKRRFFMARTEKGVVATI